MSDDNAGRRETTGKPCEGKLHARFDEGTLETQNKRGARVPLYILKRIAVLVAIAIGFVSNTTGVETMEKTKINLVQNGGFEEDEDGNNIPDFWQTAGATEIKQELARDIDRNDKGYCARLICAEFVSGTPSSHAMICQMGKISVERSKWYRLSFWAKAENVKGSLAVALQRTLPWGGVGLYKSFSIKSKWQKFEASFKATEDLPVEYSRLQIWFYSTGILWLDDVEMVESEEEKVQWNPQLPTKEIVNFIPNSSFECHTAGWGSHSPGAKSWGANVYQLFGSLDNTTSVHGKYSLCIDLSEKTSPEIFFDYFDPLYQQLKSMLIAHHGWVALEKGETYTLSTYLKADKSGVTGVLFIRQAEGRSLRKDFTLTTEWQRYTFTFNAEKDFAYTGVGLDLEASKLEQGKIWIDAVQFEKGKDASEYQTSLPVEVMAFTEQEGNIFVHNQPPYSIPLQVHAFNNSDSPQEAKFKISVRDFFDAEIINKELSLKVSAKSKANEAISLPVTKLGFFRITVSQTSPSRTGYSQQLRCAVIRPFAGDSRFGMNHAYPRNFLLRLAKKAGILWWRDWTVQWRTVQPERDGPFDFSKSDTQIDRVLRESAKVLLLFPFPSSSWARDTEKDSEAKKMSRNEYERTRMLLAGRPIDEEAFVNYIRESVKHYKNRVQNYQIFNESLYTTYSLPERLGYKMEDYIQLLSLAYQAVKKEQPNTVVDGGIGMWADSKYTKDFISGGGLQFVDALDLHCYPSTSEPEELCESMVELWEIMKKRNEPKPIWLTEFGCYADDDPAQTPLIYGDATMQKSWHSSELEQVKWFVKFATLFFANGGKKIFFHAGTIGEINGIDVGGVFFEYGGAPRKIYTAVAALANLLPPDAEFKKKEKFSEKVTAYWFSTAKEEVAVCWSQEEKPSRINLPPNTQAFDIMGNPISGSTIEITEIPVYFTQ